MQEDDASFTIVSLYVNEWREKNGKYLTMNILLDTHSHVANIAMLEQSKQQQVCLSESNIVFIMWPYKVTAATTHCFLLPCCAKNIHLSLCI